MITAEPPKHAAPAQQTQLQDAPVAPTKPKGKGKGKPKGKGKAMAKADAGQADPAADAQKGSPPEKKAKTNMNEAQQVKSLYHGVASAAAALVDQIESEADEGPWAWAKSDEIVGKVRRALDILRAKKTKLKPSDRILVEDLSQIKRHFAKTPNVLEEELKEFSALKSDIQNVDTAHHTLVDMHRVRMFADLEKEEGKPLRKGKSRISLEWPAQPRVTRLVCALLLFVCFSSSFQTQNNQTILTKL